MFRKKKESLGIQTQKAREIIKLYQIVLDTQLRKQKDLVNIGTKISQLSRAGEKERTLSIIGTSGNKSTNNLLVYCLNLLLRDIRARFPHKRAIYEDVSLVKQALNWSKAGHFQNWEELFQNAFLQLMKYADVSDLDEMRGKE